MRPDKTHVQVLRELTNEVAKALSIVFDKLWQCSEVPTDWKGRNIFKKGKKGMPGDLQARRLSVPDKIMEQIVLETYGESHGK